MGYYVDMELCEVRVKDEAGALKAINAMHQPEVVQKNGGGGCFSGNGKKEVWYSWVRNPGPEGFPTLVDALDEWRYETTIHEDGNLYIEYFIGEKLGDDDQLMLAIGPYLEGEINCRGEDGALWGYRFEDGKVVQLTGEIVWTDS